MPIPFYISDDKASLLLEFSGHRQFVSTEDAVNLANRITRAFASDYDSQYQSKTERNLTILSDYKKGIVVRVLANKFNMGQSQIYKILKDNGYTPKRQDVSQRIQRLRKKEHD